MTSGSPLSGTNQLRPDLAFSTWEMRRSSRTTTKNKVCQDHRHLSRTRLRNSNRLRHILLRICCKYLLGSSQLNTRACEKEPPDPTQSLTMFASLVLSCSNQTSNTRSKSPLKNPGKNMRTPVNLCTKNSSHIHLGDTRS
jgi:hypothetical protein